MAAVGDVLAAVPLVAVMALVAVTAVVTAVVAARLARLARVVAQETAQRHTETHVLILLPPQFVAATSATKAKLPHS